MALQTAAPPQALLVSTALLRLLRAELVHERRAHAHAEFRLHRASAREEGAAEEIEALGQEVACLQEQAIAGGDVITALKHRVASLERSAVEREDALAEKEEALLSARTGRSTCAESSAPSSLYGRGGFSDDGGESSYDSDTELDPLNFPLDAHLAALRLELAEACKRAEETVALLEDERSARAILEEQVQRLQNCARVVADDRACFADATAEVEKARRAAEEDAREARARLSEAAWIAMQERMQERSARETLQEQVGRLEDRADIREGDVARALEAASAAERCQRHAEEDAEELRCARASEISDDRSMRVALEEQIGRLEDCARVADGDLARAMDVAAEARKAQSVAEQDVGELRARILEAADEHERTVERFGADQREREEVARAAAQQSRQMLEELIAGLRLDLAESNVQVEEMTALLDDERSARALLEDHFGRLEERALVMEPELADAIAEAARAEEARLSAEEEAREFGARLRDTSKEHERTLQQLLTEQHEREDASLRAALQSQRMMESLQQAYGERAEFQSQEIATLNHRLAELEPQGAWSSDLSASVRRLLAASAAERAAAENCSVVVFQEAEVEAGTSASTSLDPVVSQVDDLPW